MTRTVPEWIGKTDDAPVPLKVRLRQFERDGGACQCGCGLKITARDKWDTDHTIAIINGGENRERNLRTLLAAHHKKKTAADVAEKSRVSRKRMKHYGLQAPRKKIQSRGFQKAPPQHTATRPLEKHRWR